MSARKSTAKAEAPHRKPPHEAHAPGNDATSAVRPHLALMAQTAEPHTHRGAAGLGLLLLWLADDVEHRANAALAEFGLSENKFDVLMIFGLAERGLIDSKVVTPSYIADYFGVTRSTVTGLLDWLEKRALLTRTLNHDDRRSISLTLTDEGRNVLARSLPKFWSMCAALVDGLKQEDRDALERILGAIWLNLKQR